MRRRLSPADLTQVDARRVCVIKPSALGDVVQTLPLLPVLRERFPQATISWVINRELSDLVAGHPCLDRVIPFERRGGFFSWRKLWNDLRSAKFDLVFDLQGLMRSGLMAKATGAPLRVGLQTAREFSDRMVDFLLPDTGRDIPAHERYWRVANALGLGDRPRETLLPMTEAHRAWAREKLDGSRGPLLVLSPGARWITKKWPVEKFAVVASKAYRAFGYRPVIVGAPADAPLGEQLAALLGEFLPASEVRNLVGQTSLLQLAAVLEAAQIVLTSDSGPMHMAAGVGSSVVGVFTCTSPILSGPPGDQHALVSTQVSCCASYRKRCPHRGRRHLACFDELTVDRVWQALQTVHARLQKRQAA